MTSPHRPDARDQAARAARTARLTPAQTAILLNVAASHAHDGRPLTEQELTVGALLMAGRIDFASYRRWLHV